MAKYQLSLYIINMLNYYNLHGKVNYSMYNILITITWQSAKTGQIVNKYVSLRKNIKSKKEKKPEDQGKKRKGPKEPKRKGT